MRLLSQDFEDCLARAGQLARATAKPSGEGGKRGTMGAIVLFHLVQQHAGKPKRGSNRNCHEFGKVEAMNVATLEEDGCGNMHEYADDNRHQLARVVPKRGVSA